jgi:hypothetical protein
VGLMQDFFFVVCIAALTSVAPAQRPATPVQNGESRQFGSVSTDSALRDMFEAKIKVEWEALKKKDKKSYAELLADDYQGVDVDG